MALLACLLLAWPLGREQVLQWRSPALAFCVLVGVVVLDVLLRRAAYTGQLLPYLACLLTVILVLLRGQQPPALLLAQTLALAGISAALIGWFALFWGSPVLDGRMYLIAAGGSVRGPLQQPNMFATQLLLAVVALGYWRVRGLGRGAWGAGMLIVAPMVALSLSRTALVNIAILALISIWLWRRNLALARVMLWACVCLLVAQAVTMPMLTVSGLNVGSTLDRVVTESAGYAVRLDLQKRAWSMFLMNPLLGVGLDGFSWQDFLLRAEAGHSSPVFLPQFTHSHNIFTQLLAEAGVPGLLSLLVLLGVFVWALYKVNNEETAMAVLGLAVLWGHSQFEFPLWYMHFLAVFGLLYAQIDSGREYNSRLSYSAKGGVIILILLGSVHFIFGMWRLDSVGDLQAKGWVNDGYARALGVAAEGGAATPYAHRVMLEIARPGGSVAANREMTEIAGRVVRWKPDSFVSYHYARWLASVGRREEAVHQLDLARRVFPGTLPAFVRDVATGYSRDGEQLQWFAHEVYLRCDELCREKAQVRFPQ